MPWSDCCGFLKLFFSGREKHGALDLDPASVCFKSTDRSYHHERRLHLRNVRPVVPCATRRRETSNHLEQSRHQRWSALRLSFFQLCFCSLPIKSHGAGVAAMPHTAARPRSSSVGTRPSCTSWTEGRRAREWSLPDFYVTFFPLFRERHAHYLVPGTDVPREWSPRHVRTPLCA